MSIWAARVLSGKESTCNAEDEGSIPGSGRFPGEGNGNPLQYSYLENPKDRGAWQATVHGARGVGHELARSKPPPPAASSSSLEPFLHPSPAAHWAPTNQGSSSFPVISYCTSILFKGFSSQYTEVICHSFLQ